MPGFLPIPVSPATPAPNFIQLIRTGKELNIPSPKPPTFRITLRLPDTLHSRPTLVHKARSPVLLPYYEHYTMTTWDPEAPGARRTAAIFTTHNSAWVGNTARGCDHRVARGPETTAFYATIVQSPHTFILFHQYTRRLYHNQILILRYFSLIVSLAGMFITIFNLLLLTNSFRLFSFWVKI